VTQPRGAGRRPRDRKQQIVAAAARQFRQSGYHNVGMTDIADAVGITGAALYRHFSGKQELLLAAVRDAIDQLAQVCHRDVRDLDELLTAMGVLTVGRPDSGVLWERELRHLPLGVQHDLRGEVRTAVAPLRAAIGNSRPALAEPDVDLLLWAVLAVFASPGYHSADLESGHVRARLVEAASALCRSSRIPGRPRPPDDTRPGVGRPGAASRGRLLPASRREAILTAAMRLFGDRGYQAVGMDEIGAAAGITGASLYHHFPGKSAILATSLNRCLEAMMFDVSSAFDAAADSAQALHLILNACVRASLEHGEAFGALLGEVGSLPDGDRRRIRAMQRDYLTEWSALLGRLRPELSDSDARVLVHATFTVVHAILRIPRLRSRPALDGELVSLGEAVLGLGS